MRSRLFALFAFFSLPLFSCQHDFPAPWIDYRSEYIGNYQVQEYRQTVIMGQPTYSHDTTYVLTVTKDPASTNALLIGGIKKEIGPSGQTSQGYGSNFESLQFQSGCISWNTRSGGLGGFSTTSITGCKFN